MFVEEIQEDGHCRWHLARAERFNSLGTTMSKELSQLMAKLKKKKNKPKSLTITAESIDKGSGPIWVAGGDLKELAKLKSSAAARQYAKTLSDFCLDLEKLPIPVIALVDGAALGGGAELALAADIRIASKNASFVFKQLEIGLMLGYGSSKRLLDLVGRSNAQKLVLLGDTVTAGQAHDMGLVHVLCDSDGDLLNRYEKIKAHLETIHPEAYAAQKRAFFEVDGMDRAKALSFELRLFEALWMNPSHKNFLKKY